MSETPETKTAKTVKIAEYKAFGESAMERVVIRNVSPIKISKDGITISFTPIGEDEYTGIQLIIENPEKVEGIIEGSLSIPFPKNGDTKILVIPSIIELRLSIETVGALTVRPQATSTEMSRSGNFNYKPGTFADKAKISTLYNESKGGGKSSVPRDFINPHLPELLKKTITENMKELVKKTCKHAVNTNCLLVVLRLNSSVYFICGNCKGFLAQKEGFKCKNYTECGKAVYIDAQGNINSNTCNDCSD